jgi:hypothetical protein
MALRPCSSAASLLAALALAGCASLPGIGDLERDAAAQSGTRLEIVGPDGRLTGEHRAAIERRIQGRGDMGLQHELAKGLWSVTAADDRIVFRADMAGLWRELSRAKPGVWVGAPLPQLATAAR